VAIRLHRFLRLLPAAWLLMFAALAQAQVHVSPLDNWRTLATPRISVHHRAQDRELAEKSLAIAEQSLPQLETLLRWQVSTHLHINLVDRQDDANGWATPLPYNHVTLYTTPPTAFGELSDYNRWMRLLIAHELTHIVHLDKARGAPKGLRRVFGRFPLLFPNAWQPDFFTEGLATWVETDRAAGFGRGQSALFAAMMRMEVASGPLRLGEAQQYRSEWPMNHAYLYGVYFYQYLESVHGRQKIPEYIDNYSTHIVPFVMSSTSIDVTGKGIASLWRDYLAWLEKRFRPEIIALQQQGLTPATRLSERGYITGRPLAFAPGQLAWVDVGLDAPSYLVLRRADGVQLRLTRVQADARPIAVHGDWLYFLQAAACGDRPDFSDLFRVRVDADRLASMAAHALGNGMALGLAERVTQCARYTHGSLDAEGKRFVFVQSLTGRQQLVLRELHSAATRVIWQGGFDDQVAQPVWLDAQTLVASVKRADAKWQLLRIAVADGAMMPLPLALPRGNAQTPFLDHATQRLYFTADHSGVPEIYRSQADGSGVVRVTRSLAASVDPWVAEGRLYFSGYTPQGWDIFVTDAAQTLAADAPLLTRPEEAATGMTLQWPAEDLRATGAPQTSEHRYRALPALLPRSWFPAAYSAGDAQEFGAMFNGNDPLYFHQYNGGVAREFGIDKTSGVFEYIGWNHLLLAYRRDYTIDGNGLAPEDAAFAVEGWTQREDRQAALFHTLPLQFSEITLFAGHNEARDRYADLRTGAPRPLHDVGVATQGAGFIYTASAQFRHGVSESHGRRVKFSLEHDEMTVRDVMASGTVTRGDNGGDVRALDWREYLALGKRHVLALRAMAGRGDAGVSRFRLGSETSMTQFALPYVNDREIALRGYPDGLRELSDVNAELLSAEWRIPLPAINRGIDGLPLGAHTAYATVFYDAGKAWGTAPNPVHEENARRFDSLGAELLLVLDIGFSMLPMQVRLGYAQPLVDDPRVASGTVYFTLGSAF
jgi:hypothetical protein